MWLAVIYNFRLALLRESDGANKHGAAVARGGISPMSSSPTYSDALHCEQKKWRHYHHLQKFSFLGVFLLVSNGVNPFESESEDIYSRLDSFLPVFCAPSTRQGVSCLAVTKKLQSSSSWGFCVWLQYLEDVRQRKDEHSSDRLWWFKELIEKKKRGEKWRSVPSKYSTFPGQPIQWWRCFQARQGRISEFF